MALPFFYVASLKNEIVYLDEDTSKHLIGVLRKTVGDLIHLTDGKGSKATAIIIDDNRKKSVVQIKNLEEVVLQRNVAIGISLIKNTSRFEWFLEKATEIGITEIIPLICDRTEKEHFRHGRMEQILISAMLQSQQCWLPRLSEPVSFENVLKKDTFYRKFIAHCLPQQKKELSRITIVDKTIILIGPEGDFTTVEIDLALQSGYLPVSLGTSRLRTETAGMVAAVLLSINAKD